MVLDRPESFYYVPYALGASKACGVDFVYITYAYKHMYAAPVNKL